MRVLAVTNPGPDYLADAFLIGARRRCGGGLVEYPRKDILYAGADLSGVRGAGFTLYGVLPKAGQHAVTALLPEDLPAYDLVVFTSIYRQYEVFLRLLPGLSPARTVVLDGEDKENIFGYAGKFWRDPGFWRKPRPHARFPYYKREWTPKTMQSLVYKLVPKRWAAGLPAPPKLRRIGFAIPEEKIATMLHAKAKDFPLHVVDPEVAARVSGARTSYGFDDEAAYYADLRASRFGVTTKRGGWDCLRHYEIAANAAVPCFRDLDRKPATCAPHDLVIGRNCLSYRDYDDLRAQTGGLSPKQYGELQAGALAWVRGKTCRALAAGVMDQNE